MLFVLPDSHVPFQGHRDTALTISPSGILVYSVPVKSLSLTHQLLTNYLLYMLSYHVLYFCLISDP